MALSSSVSSGDAARPLSKAGGRGKTVTTASKRSPSSKRLPTSKKNSTYKKIPTPTTNPMPSRGLLENPLVFKFMRSPLWPGLLAYPTLEVFGYIVYSLLWGPGAASANTRSGLTWVFWWPLIPLAMFAAGRLWCAICPFGKLIDLVQKFAGLGRPVPPFLKRYGIWVIDATFLLTTWADHAFGIVESPRGSGYLLGLLITASLVTGGGLRAAGVVPLPLFPRRAVGQLLANLRRATPGDPGNLRYVQGPGLLQGRWGDRRLPRLRSPARNGFNGELQLLCQLHQELSQGPSPAKV